MVSRARSAEIIRRDKELAKRVPGCNTDTDDVLERTYQVWLSDRQAVPYSSPQGDPGGGGTSTG